MAQAILPASDSMRRGAAGVAERIVCLTCAVSPNLASLRLPVQRNYA